MFDIIFENHEFEKQSYMFFSRILHTTCVVRMLNKVSINVNTFYKMKKKEFSNDEINTLQFKRISSSLTSNIIY